MARLSMTLIDVGWGDSILIEVVGDDDVRRFALVDCNDYETERSSLIFVKRVFQNQLIKFKDIRQNFEWVLLTHGHADHARGLKRMLSTFGTRNLWYPKSVESTTYATILDYANRYTDRVLHHQAIDRTKILNSVISFGGVTLDVLWPDYDVVDQDNENNNSVVLALTLGEVTFVLTGDAEAEKWPAIVDRLPNTVRVFQVPHHGGRNGTLTPTDDTPWLVHLADLGAPSNLPQLALSSHVVPHGHPHLDVINAIGNSGFESFRTDVDSHLTFTTDGVDVDVRFSHVEADA